MRNRLVLSVRGAALPLLSSVVRAAPDEVEAGEKGKTGWVVGILTAVLFLGERPSPLHLAGGAAILLGLTLLLRSKPLPDPPGGPAS